MEQLGYQAESSTFRNAYLNAAQELRLGPPPNAGQPVRARGILSAMTVEQVLDAMSFVCSQRLWAALLPAWLTLF